MNFDGNNVDNMAGVGEGAGRQKGQGEQSGVCGKRFVWLFAVWRMESTVNALHIVVVIGESVC